MEIWESVNVFLVWNPSLFFGSEKKVGGASDLSRGGFHPPPAPACGQPWWWAGLWSWQGRGPLCNTIPCLGCGVAKISVSHMAFILGLAILWYEWYYGRSDQTRPYKDRVLGLYPPFAYPGVLAAQIREIMHLFVVSLCVLSCPNRLTYDLDFQQGCRPWPRLEWDCRSRS